MSRAFLLAQSGFMLYTVLGGQKWSGKLPVWHISCQYTNAVWFMSYTQAFALCNEHIYEEGSFAGRARLSLSLTSCSITPQTVSLICTPIMGEALLVASVTPLGGLCG